MNTIILWNKPYSLHKDQLYNYFKSQLYIIVPGECLEAVIAPVHEVPHEDVVGVWRWAPLSEQLLQVIELAVDVATHRHGAGHGLDVALFEQEVAH